MDQRSGVGRFRPRLTGQGREDARGAAAIGSVAGRTEFFVQALQRAWADAAASRWGPPARRPARRARRQRLQISGDGAQIVVGQILRAVLHHLGHVAESGSAIRAAGPAERSRCRLRSTAQAVFVAAQALGIPASMTAPARIRSVTLGQRFLLQGEAARRVASAAMSEALHQISTAIPLRVASGIGLEWSAAKEQSPKNTAGNGNSAETEYRSGRSACWTVRRRAGNNVESCHVSIADLGVGRKRHGRIKICPSLATPSRTARENLRGYKSRCRFPGPA